MKKVYNFDIPVDRVGTSCIKYDGRGEALPEGVIPMHIADMDFPVADGLVEALVKRASHPIYGYSGQRPRHLDAIVEWMGKRHNVTVQKDWIVPVININMAMRWAVAAFTEVGDTVAMLAPVYGPFFGSAESLGRKVVKSNLLRTEENTYAIDFEDLEEKIKGAKMMMFCSPHNPGGRVWTMEELTKVAEMCHKHGALLVADEIHCDLILPGYKHNSCLSLPQELKDNTMTLISISKSFNCAGLTGGSVIIPSVEILEKYKAYMASIGLGGGGNLFASVAVEAAYTHSEDWLDQVMEYIKGNYDYVTEFIAKHIPKLSSDKMEGTYLMWIDARKIATTTDEVQGMLGRAKIKANDGTFFGKEGEGFFRLNIATCRANVEKAMENLKATIDAM